MPFVCSQGRTLSHQQWRVFICLSGCFQHNKTLFFRENCRTNNQDFSNFRFSDFFWPNKSSPFFLGANKSPRLRCQIWDGRTLTRRWCRSPMMTLEKVRQVDAIVNILNRGSMMIHQWMLKSGLFLGSHSSGYGEINLAKKHLQNG